MNVNREFRTLVYPMNFMEAGSNNNSIIYLISGIFVNCTYFGSFGTPESSNISTRTYGTSSLACSIL